MEELPRVTASSDPQDYENDRGRKTSNVYAADLDEEQSKTPMTEDIKTTIKKGGSPTVPPEDLPSRNHLSLDALVESDNEENNIIAWMLDVMLDALEKNGEKMKPKELLQALQGIKVSDCSEVIDLSKDPATPMLFNLAGCDESTLQKLKIAWSQVLQPSLDEELSLDETAALARSVKPGRLRLEGYTVSWKPSEVPCFVEHTYQYKDSKLKIWLAKACHYMLEDSAMFAKLLHSLYVREQVAKEQLTVSKELSEAKANLRRNPYVTGDLTDYSWVAIACGTTRRKALLAQTTEAIAKLRATGFTRANLTLKKLSEFASNINSGLLDLPTLVKYLSSLSQVPDMQSPASTVAKGSALDTELNSDSVILAPERRKKRKPKKKHGQQHASQVIDSPQIEASSVASPPSHNALPLSQSTMAIEHDETSVHLPVDQDHSVPAAPDVLASTSGLTAKERKLLKRQRQKANRTTATATSGDPKGALEVAEDHQLHPVLPLAEPSLVVTTSTEVTEDHQLYPVFSLAEPSLVTTKKSPTEVAEDHQLYPVLPLAEPSLVTTKNTLTKVGEDHQLYPVFPLAAPSLDAMKNSPTTFMSRTVQRPIDHRKIKSGTELELQKLQLPPEELVEAKDRLLSESSPLSLKQVRDYNREIENSSHEIGQENRRMMHGIVDIVRERSRAREANTLSYPYERINLPVEQATTAAQNVILVHQAHSHFNLLATIVETHHENIQPPSADELESRHRVIHRRCRSEPQDIYKIKTKKIQANHSVALGERDDDEDLSEDEAEDSEQLVNNGASRVGPLLRDPHPYTPWTTSLVWGYDGATNELRNLPPGTPTYRFPRPVKISTANLRGEGMLDCPVYMLQEYTQNVEPIVTYNEEIDRYEIKPHSRAWRDIRSNPGHPDYLPPGKLCQYQAYEFAKFVVWRHDRDQLYCKLPTCGKPTFDHDLATMICHGCGTKSRVRYCTKAHLLQDIQDHWKICGTPEEVLDQPIDPGTQPDRFYRRYPAIADVHEDPITTKVFKYRSFQKHRQQTYAIFNKGQYTLFLGGSTPQIVEWPEDLAEKYMPRVERLLNMAFFSQSTTGSLLYLYYLLRYCLRLQHKWTDETALVLKMQFRLEFKYDTDLADDEDPCECYWAGELALVKDCTPTCRAMLFDNFGVVCRGGGIKALAEQYEGGHWPLRIWQRRHPTVKGWKYRLRGIGFPEVPDHHKVGSGLVPNFGKGWEGYGAYNGHPAGDWREED
ncbi:hypothetical protein MMC11_000987 [Xylographa trunciseda]|nr:hypothetical protein [Xylographa trunciseda]